MVTQVGELEPFCCVRATWRTCARIRLHKFSGGQQNCGGIERGAVLSVVLSPLARRPGMSLLSPEPASYLISYRHEQASGTAGDTPGPRTSAEIDTSSPALLLEQHRRPVRTTLNPARPTPPVSLSASPATSHSARSHPRSPAPASAISRPDKDASVFAMDPSPRYRTRQRPNEIALSAEDPSSDDPAPPREPAVG